MLVAGYATVEKKKKRGRKVSAWQVWEASRECWCVLLIKREDFPAAQTVKNPPAMQETRVQSLGREEALETGMATHSSILAWRSPWTEKPGGLQFVGLQRDTTEQLIHTHTETQWHTHTHTHSDTPTHTQTPTPTPTPSEGDHSRTTSHSPQLCSPGSKGTTSPMCCT